MFGLGKKCIITMQFSYGRQLPNRGLSKEDSELLYFSGIGAVGQPLLVFDSCYLYVFDSVKQAKDAVNQIKQWLSCGHLQNFGLSFCRSPLNDLSVIDYKVQITSPDMKTIYN